MSTSDYFIGVAALGLILWNMRRHELTDRRLRRPLIIAAIVAVNFLHGVPTAGADAALVAIGVLIGIGCGALSALATRVERDPTAGTVIATATRRAVAITALAFGGRMAFAVAATNGLGPEIGRFSHQVGIDSANAWIAALVLMAIADLATRALVLWHRRRAFAAPPTATATA
jgi:hypothetical protein